MFSKALFKQSCKANGAMWSIITFAVCFMLACVMLISGNGNIGEVKNSIQDTIITKEVDAQLERRALSYYSEASDGMKYFDMLFSDNVTDTVAYLTWCSQMPTAASYPNTAVLTAATEKWKKATPKMKTEAGKAYAEEVDKWLKQMPSVGDFKSAEEYTAALKAWQKKTPASKEKAGYKSDSDEALEMLGSVMYSLNPNGQFNDFYTENGETAPEDYDYMSLINHITTGDIKKYLSSEERDEYISDRAEKCTAVFLAGNMTKSEMKEALTEALSDYGVTEEKYDSFGYTYDSIKHMARTAVVTYKGMLEYETDLLAQQKKDGKFADEKAYLNALADKKSELAEDISTSFLSTLPQQVSDALEEIGQADLYTLIVGSIFYKLAGLLLPIIYMIMASNNLISGQVDSGSMAYVLSTSTKRSTVVFTQAVYLIGSLLAMFGLTTVTGCVCLSLVTEEVELTYGKLVLLNVGAFLVLLALSGLCFLTSCFFDRSKRSMAIGGGLSIFALVAAMLGLFGSPVIPSVVRLEALNNFNYATIISMFDVISIIDGTNDFIWKFAALGIAGILGYIIGSVRFTKKDLPL